MAVMTLKAQPEPTTLEEMKAAACAQVRDRRWRSHIVVTVGGVEFASDDTAATRLTAAITARHTAQALGLEAADATVGWEAKDGTMVPMTLNDLRGLLHKRLRVRDGAGWHVDANEDDVASLYVDDCHLEGARRAGNKAS